MNKRLILRIAALLGLLGLAALAYVLWLRPLREGAAVGLTSTPNPAAYQTAAVRKGDLTSTIGTTGAVRSKQSAVLVWQTSGTVGTVHVALGQVVAARTILAEMEQTTLPQPVILARAEQVTAQKNLDNLMQSTVARANAQMALIHTEKALEDARENRDSKLYQRASPETIDLARARLITANEALDQAEDLFERVSGADQDGVVYAAGLSQLAKARQDQIRAQYNLDFVSGLPEPLDIEEADAAVAVAEANLLQARLDWERIKDGPNDEDIAAAEARLAAAQASMNLARISAPFAGTLTLVESQAGDQVQVGSLAFQLDDLSQLLIDVAVAELDIAQVRVGQAVTIRLDALPGAQYAGLVKEIGAVGKTVAGTVNFPVTVEWIDPDEQIRPGMTVSVEIAVGQAEDALLVPTRAVRMRGGEMVVYLLRDGAPAAVAVTLGATSGQDTVVLGGEIQAGDAVILNPSGIE